MAGLRLTLRRPPEGPPIVTSGRPRVPRQVVQEGVQREPRNQLSSDGSKAGRTGTLRKAPLSRGEHKER